VERYQGRPFAFLGINSDDDPKMVKTFMAREGLPWRSWWDQGAQGPIAKRYRVSGWPTLYVLDADGVIRYVQVRGRSLDNAVDTLVRQAEQKAAVQQAAFKSAR
jgi:hypothetical protein